MTIYPAIDLHQGRCVRLRRGDLAQQTVFSDDPAEMARRWESQGAEWIHVVDLDGAFSGNPKNDDAISEIVKSVSTPIQLGGGLRSLAQVRSAFKSGVRRAIIGTAALENPKLVFEACLEFPERVAVGIDARHGLVATHGWKVTSSKTASELAFEMEKLGVCVIIYTDISRDGMLEGPNIRSTQALAESLTIRVIASGGVSSLEDIAALRKISTSGVEGVIIGRSLYEGKFTLSEAIKVAKGVFGDNIPPLWGSHPLS